MRGSAADSLRFDGSQLGGSYESGPVTTAAVNPENTADRSGYLGSGVSEAICSKDIDFPQLDVPKVVIQHCRI